MADNDNYKMNRIEPVSSWNNDKVMTWLCRHSTCTSNYYGLYGHLFVKRKITGRELVGMKESSLARIGVINFYQYFVLLSEKELMFHDDVSTSSNSYI